MQHFLRNELALKTDELTVYSYLFPYDNNSPESSSVHLKEAVIYKHERSSIVEFTEKFLDSKGLEYKRIGCNLNIDNSFITEINLSGLWPVISVRKDFWKLDNCEYKLLEEYHGKIVSRAKHGTRHGTRYK